MSARTFAYNSRHAAPVLAKRIYGAPSTDDGSRVLVDRIWPRGISRNRAQLDAWLPDVAPSTALERLLVL